MTRSRLRKPIRNMMWMKSQASQASVPESLILPRSATAADRPMVASEPLSRSGTAIGTRRECADDVLRGVRPFLDRGRGDAGDGLAVGRQAGQVADDEGRCPGIVRSGTTLSRRGRAARPATDPAGRPSRPPPTARCATRSLVAEVDPVSSMPVTILPVRTSTPSRTSCFAAFSESSGA